MSKGGSELVTATVISREFGIPIATVYRMAKLGRLPAHDVTKPYQARRYYLFSRDDVRRKLDELAEKHAPPDPAP